MKVTKITTIENLAVFKDFKWDDYVKDKDGRILTFQDINIIYGRNYSGKTTLSRIFRAFETGKISDKYVNPKFQLVNKDGDQTSGLPKNQSIYSEFLPNKSLQIMNIKNQPRRNKMRYSVQL